MSEKPYTANKCFNAARAFATNLIEKKVIDLTSKAYDNAIGFGTTNYTVQESPDNLFNKEIIKQLKELGYEIIETSNTHYVFSWKNGWENFKRVLTSQHSFAIMYTENKYNKKRSTSYENC